MSRREFLERLDELLKDIPREEREEAMQYYNSYFEDAGEKNDADIIEELGSPEKVAEAVKADFSSAPVVYEEPASQEKSSNHTQQSQNHSYDSGQQSQNNSYNNTSYHNGRQQKQKPWSNKPLKVILLIILLIVAAPALFSLLSLVLGLFVGFIVLCFAFAVAAAVGVILGGFLLIKGFAIVVSTTGVGLLLLGFGLLGIVIGIVLLVAFVKGCLMVFPFLFRKIKELIMWIRRKIGGH